MKKASFEIPAGGGDAFSVKGQAEHVYDAVVVGAGIAGLTCADALKEMDVLVLEKEERAGGRILTRFHGDIPYDLGAIFSLNQDVLPFDLDGTDEMKEEAPVGLFFDNRLHFGRDPLECMKGIDLHPEERVAIWDFCRDLKMDAGHLPKRIYTVLNGFFQVIHPGEMKDYIPRRQRDAVIRINTSHFKCGNGEIIKRFVMRLGEDKLRLGARVYSVSEEKGRVRVEYIRGGHKEQVLARHVVVAATPQVALKIIERIEDPCRAFLGSLYYAEGTVVVFGFQGADFSEFSYMVTPDIPISTIIKQKTHRKDVDLLFIYYAGVKTSELKGCSEARKIDRTWEFLSSLKIGKWSKENLLFSDSHVWPEVGPVITAESYGGWKRHFARPSGRVFLAGENVFVDPGNIFPYGMVAGVVSGKGAASQVKQSFKDRDSSMECLVRASIYEMTEKKPVFKGTVEEGNVAPYGLILLAEPDEDIGNYLLRNRRHSLWEWQPGFGVTAEDSALVMEGLYESGISGERLMPSVRQLVKIFYSQEEGAFVSLHRGRAAYWQGPSVDATAHVGYLLDRIAQGVFSQEVAACAKFIGEHQFQPGYWEGKWFPSRMVTTFHAVRFLRRMGLEFAEGVERALQYVLQLQRGDGSWGKSVIDTAAAIMTLKGVESDGDVCRRGREWLLSNKSDGVWKGEPVLYYWFEVEAGRKLFYHCVDKGRITTAWAKRALKM